MKREIYMKVIFKKFEREGEIEGQTVRERDQNTALNLLRYYHQ